MSLSPITDDNYEFHSIEAHPSRSYSSRPRRNVSGAKIYFTGSNGNLEEVLDNTGSVNVFSFNSPFEKEAQALVNSNFTGFSDDNLESLRRNIINSTDNDINSKISSYITLVNESTQSLRKQAKQEIVRFNPSVQFTSNTLRKTIVTNHLMEHYRTALPSMHFNISNYNSLHFFHDAPNPTDFIIPSSSVIMFPNPRGKQITSGVFDSNYGFKEGEPFSFDFWIKPNYTTNEGEEFRPGTILHLTGAYAISVHSGSVKNAAGKPSKFKLMLQLGTGSYIPPSIATEDPVGGVYVSADNVLELNKWQHVTIVYAGANTNYGTGSFFIDGINKGDFSFSSSGYGLWNETVSPTLAPSVLCVGNFFDGPPIMEEFFNSTTALREGITQLSSASADVDIDDFNFSHPFRGELHDIKIYNKRLNSDEISLLQEQAPSSLKNLKFYLPPFFTEEAPYRQFVGEYGGVLTTPFFEKNGTTTKPFGSELAFSSNGHYMNIENYLRDFATGTYPRLWHLTGSSLEPGNSVVTEANVFLYSSGANAGSNKKRLYTIMPCDHGDWSPNFSFLEKLSGSKTNGIYKNDLNNFIPGMVSLRNIVTGAYVSFLSSFSGSDSNPIVDDVLGVGPEPAKLTETSTDDLTIYNRLRSGDSNQVVLFDISNLYYGNSILPGTLTLTDPFVSGSDGLFTTTLKDDGLGNLYRADAKGTHATWASVGNVFYNEGIVLIKTPQFYFFGSEGFDINFKGMHNLHVMTINCYARDGELVSSSNPSYDVTIQADPDLANEPDQRFVYITGINIHDENLNIIGRSHLSQPLMKKTGDKMLFKWKIDY